MTTAREEQWWSAEEFAEELGVKPRWLKDRCAPSRPEADRFPHQRLDGIGIRFSPEDRKAIKDGFAQGPRPTQPPVAAQIDIAAGLKGLAKLHKLQGAAP